jgi:type VII secretion integral membrane protein EccD
VIVASTRVPAHAAGAGALLAGLILLTAAPRIAVSAARIPIPPVPAPGEGVEAGDLEDIDHDVRGRDADDRRPRGPLPTPTVLRHRFLTSRSWLTGLLASAGTICTAGSLVSLTGGSGPTRWAAPLAVVLTMVLVLRGLGYADRVHTALLLGSALVLTAGVLVGAVVTQPSPVGVVVPTAAAVAAAVVLAATVLPHVTFSPAALRAVGTIEAIGICVLVPLAVGAMDVYSLVRQR